MHIAMEYFKHMAGVKIVHVPYRGSNVVVPDLLAGRVAMYIATLSVFDQYAKEGKLKVLAAATEKRLPQRPELPTMGETVPGYFISSWFGMGAPAGTPSAILDRIHADVAKSSQSPPSPHCSSTSSSSRRVRRAARSSPRSSVPSTRSGASWCASPAPRRSNCRQQGVRQTSTSS